MKNKKYEKEIAASLNKTKGENKRFDGLVNQYIMIENDDVEINSITDIRNIFDLIVPSEILEKDLPDGNLFRKILLVYMTMLKVNGFTEMNLMNQKFLNI